MNVVLVCFDTFRADCVAAAGRNSFIKTPNIDRIAREGVLFDNAFAEGLPTIQFRRALCTGMRSFPWDRDYDTTGLWPTISGWHKIPPEQKTLAEVLLDAGYATGMASDTYHMFKATQNFTRGMAAWEFIRGQETDAWRAGPLSAVDLAKYTKKGVTLEKSLQVIAQYLVNMVGRKTELDYLTPRVFTSAIRFLEDNQNNQPFFLWVDSFGPHEPWDPPKEFADLYDPGWDEGWEPIIGLPDQLDEKVRRRACALYYGYCTFADKQLGRLLDTLDRTGLAKDTLVIVTSDHGTELWDHGVAYKNKQKCRYRHTSEIVLAMRFPGGQHAGKRVSGFVQNQDLYPTILGLLGVKGPQVDGLDFMPLVTGEKHSLRDVVITGWSGNATARSLDYAYSCEAFSENPEETLFDLKNDPGESTNIVAQQPQLAADYRARIEELLGQKLPATPRDKTHAYPSPCSLWANKAPWAQELWKAVR